MADVQLLRRLRDQGGEVMRVLVTGSRDWPSPKVIWQALTELYEAAGEPLTVVHGACPTGADAAASEWVRELRCGIEEKHPADWKVHGRAAGPIRNKEMVSLGADVCLVFMKDNSRGTSHCAQKAFAAGIDTRIWRL
jgi:hypothetical protein